MQIILLRIVIWNYNFYKWTIIIIWNRTVASKKKKKQL